MAKELSSMDAIILKGLADGDFEVAGYNSDGAPRFRLTEQGRCRYEAEVHRRRLEKPDDRH